MSQVANHEECVPLLLRRLAATHRNYFWALGAITQAQPALGITIVPEAVAAWQRWGRDNGYLDADNNLITP